MVWLSVLIVSLGADAFVAHFDRANEAYQAGRYAEAAAAYEALASDGVADPALFLNLGNAYYRAGRLGPAVANYERALDLAPGMDAAAQNLELALRQTERNLAKPLRPAWEQALLFWHARLPYGAVRAAAIVAWLAFWAAAALRLWRPLRYTRAAAAALGAIALALAASAWVKAQPSPLAVASAPAVPVRYGPGDGETLFFELYEGDRVTVDRREADWVRVGTVDGQRGWARASALTFVGPPYAPAPPPQPAPASPAPAPPAPAGPAA